MNGAGNDFILFDNRTGGIDLDRNQIAKLCDRHRGIGADGILLLEQPTNRADFRMRYFNADGGEAEMCGNGARCFARFAYKVGGKKEKNFLRNTGWRDFRGIEGRFGDSSNDRAH